MSASYTISLPQFEGPFDLLLFFIERDELDIHDIPIAKITDDFLGYIRQMEMLNIDLASEFILVAATLMRIKAKMLIPRKPVDEEGNEIDPREELVLRLLEYKRYKSVLEDMRKLEERRSYMLPRGNTHQEIKKIAEVALVDVELESVTLYKLMKAFERVMQRMHDRSQKKTVHKVFTWPYTIQDQQIYLLSSVKKGERRSFDEVFGICKSRVHAIVTFLALLELLNLQRIGIVVGEGINNFWLKAVEEPEEEASASEEKTSSASSEEKASEEEE
ncbi:MAG: segregation/condensation protein A [Bacteroidota bacterium]